MARKASSTSARSRKTRRVTSRKAAPRRTAPASRRSSRLQPSKFPSNSSLDALYASLLKYPNVEGCYVGRKSRGKRLTTELAIVCCVRKKGTEGLTAGQCIPKRLRWPRTRRESFDLPTDVREIGASELQQLPAVVGPGDELRPSPVNGAATIGVAMRHPTLGRVVTTAGHALMGEAAGTLMFDASTPPVRIGNVGAEGSFSAVPLKAVRMPVADYALLRPVAEPRNLFQDRFNLSGLRLARPEDEGTPLFALTRRRLEATVLRGAAGTFTMGGIQMRGLLLTDPVTVPGDSGCCLVDSAFRVWGLLVGLQFIDGKPMSIFASADFVLALETAEFG